MPRRTACLLLAAALLAAPGCKGKAKEERAATGAASTQPADAAPDHGGGAPPDATAGKPQGTAAGHAPGPGRGLLSNGAPADATASEEAGLAARRAARMAAARAMTLDPATGGTYRSADGRVAITIPPGALATGGTVRFWPVETADLPEGQAGMPGLAIDGDWGDATFQPGAKVSFKAPVDDRFVKRTEALGAEPGQLALSRDDQGRTYLEVTMTVDEQGRPASVQQSRLGRGGLTEVAQLPVAPSGAWAKAARAASRDGVPVVPEGTPTMAPLPADDPLVATWPGVPVEKYHAGEYRPVGKLDRKPDPIRIRSNLASTIAGDPAMITCAASECRAPVYEPVLDAIRLNTAIASRRAIPDGLRQRTANPALACPPDGGP